MEKYGLNAYERDSMTKSELPRYVKIPGTPGAFRVIGVSVNTAGERLAKLAYNRSSAETRPRTQEDAWALAKDLERATLKEYKAFVLEGKKLREIGGSK